ncbi:MAG: putative peptidoglycan glycosyltransferase FtsW [Candidatus Gracilibacteria bacterium]|nr:putative peptidoglycan glycosyltransferase FtsW [Candidatus Gracilibacteria bacterium]
MKKNVDYKLFFTVLFLVVFGMIMISSVSVYSSFKLTDKMVSNGLIESSYNYFYVLRNIGHVIISMVLLGFIVKINYTLFEKYSKNIFYVAIGLMLFVLIMGMSLKGAKGWISIPGIPFTIQPTEFLKLALIIYLAAFFKKFKGYLESFKRGYIPFMTILGGVTLLVALQPDFGTIMVIVPVSVIMYFYAGMNPKHLLTTIGIGCLLLITVYSIGDYDKETGKNINSLGYITQRIDNYLADNEEAIKNKTINYQTEQALIAIGSGGFKGLGFGGSIQKFGYLPEVQGDFIFSVVIEELGFIGGLVLMSLYMFIGYRGFYIASRVPDLFAKYVSIGISSRILIQAFINIGVNLNIVPLTGITLPFISYGGSSLLTLAIGLAIQLNISRYIDSEQQFSRLNRKKFMF